MALMLAQDSSAGLSAAYQLRRLGFQVSLYETKDELGGLMRYGIPSYRLARDVLDGEINRIIAMGITLHTGHEVADATGLGDLQSMHDAVYLATAIGAGSLVGSWMNDSGFWIFAKMGGLTETEALKSWTLMLAFLGLVAFAVTLLLATVLPLA